MSLPQIQESKDHLSWDVSVVIPAYLGRKTISDCIASVIAGCNDAHLLWLSLKSCMLLESVNRWHRRKRLATGGKGLDLTSCERFPDRLEE